jgi:hypothetical protein
LTAPTSPLEFIYPPSPRSPHKSSLLGASSPGGVSSAAIMKKSPQRQKKRSQTVDITPKVPPSIRTLKDVLLLPADYPESGISDVETCDFQGFLYKRGGHAHWSWKKRYFVLKHMTLWYFKSDAPTAKVLGLIILPSYQILPAKNTNVKSGNFTFVAEHPDARTYWLRAESCQDMTDWMNAMVRASLGLPALNNCLDLLSNASQSRRPSVANSTAPSTALNPTNAQEQVLSMTSSSAAEEGQQQQQPKAVPPHQHGLDASIAMQMEALIKNVKELHSSGKKMPPPPVPLKPGHLVSSSCKEDKTSATYYKPPISELEMQRRETILDTVNLKSSMEYVLWINNVLFSNDVIVISEEDVRSSQHEIDIPPLPSTLEPIKYLHLDITNGLHLIELLLRLISREFIKDFFSHNHSQLLQTSQLQTQPSIDGLDNLNEDNLDNDDQVEVEVVERDWQVYSKAVKCLFDHYRQLIIPKPYYRVQMIDNLNVVWLLMRSEISSAQDRFKYWIHRADPSKYPEPISSPSPTGLPSQAGGNSEMAVGVSSNKLIDRLEKLNVNVEGIYSGNLEQILLLLNEIERNYPMEDEEEFYY